MSQRRGRVANKTSMVASPPSKTKGKAGACSVQKKTPVKRSSPRRPKRLSGLTAATLLHYCTNILSPTSKKRASAKKLQRNTSHHSMEDDGPPQTSDVVEAVAAPPPVAVRSRREASSRASAMIMQQNEIERSRFNYTLPQRRVRVKSPPLLKEPAGLNIPVILNPIDAVQPSSKPLPPPVAKYPPLTEALLAEHNRLHGITPSYHTTKRDNLMKWTQDLPSYDSLSSPFSEQDIPLETSAILLPSSVEEKNRSVVQAVTGVSMASNSSFHPGHGHFLSPSSYPLDLRSFYPILPCWQYPPAWPFALKSFHLHSAIENKSVTISSQCAATVLAIQDRLVENKSLGPLAVKNGCNDSEEGRKKTMSRRKASPKKRARTQRRSSRGRRTNSSPSVRQRVRSSTDKKRTHSASSISFPVLNRSVKRAKVSNSWTLFGKFERQLVSIEADQAPVYRKCYSSIRHLTERDIIKSNDCVILRPDAGHRTGATPYLAKVKWFWEEAISGEIRMSLLWYYHPEHTELSPRVKERFLVNELLASNYADCINVACIEDKCYVLTLDEYNRYFLREKRVDLFEPISDLKFLLNKNNPGVHHRPLPAKHVDQQNVFFCRSVYDYRSKRIVKNPF